MKRHRDESDLNGKQPEAKRRKTEQSSALSFARELLSYTRKALSNARIKRKYAYCEDDTFALIRAMELDDVEAIDFFLKSNALHPVRRYAFGDTVLHLAITKNNIATIQRLLNKIPYRSIPNCDGLMPFHVAVHVGNLESVQMLLENGAGIDINTREIGSEEMPLHQAIYSNNLELVQLLLDNGADVNQLGGGGVVSWTNETNGSNCEWGINWRRRLAPLHMAVWKDDLELTQLLLNHDANVNLQAPHNGYAPLHTAVCTSNLESVQTLLENGADINLQDQQGNTPLHIAIFCDDYDLAQILLTKEEINLNLPNQDGNTPLLLTRCRGNDEIEQALLDRIHTDAQNATSQNPIVTTQKRFRM